MTIDEAIKRLSQLEWAEEYGTDPGIIPAIKLGIEALKWRQEVMRDPGFRPLSLLPGETEE